MGIRVYLAWQRIGDGRKQVRRWSPDQPNLFLGYQKQNPLALHWLSMNGDPLWPNCHQPDAEPFQVVEYPPKTAGRLP